MHTSLENSPTVLLDFPGPQAGVLDLSRTSPDSREFTGSISLPPAMLKQLAIGYLEAPSKPALLTVRGQKQAGCARFAGIVQAGEIS